MERTNLKDYYLRFEEISNEAISLITNIVNEFPLKGEDKIICIKMITCNIYFTFIDYITKDSYEAKKANFQNAMEAIKDIFDFRLENMKEKEKQNVH